MDILTNQIRILMVIDQLRSGGRERRLVQLLKGLRNHEIPVELVVLSDEIHYKEVNQLGYRIHLLHRKMKKDPSIVFALFKISKRFNPTIIQSWESMVSVYCFPISLFLGIKFINAMISNAPETLKPFSRLWVRSKLTFNFSHAIVANSKAGLASYSPPPARSFLIPNGFDFTRINSLADPIEIRRKFGVVTPFVIGMVASFTEKKDYTTFILAAQEILQKRNDITFMCIGDGPLINQFKSLVTKEHLDRIIFLGKQQNVENIMNIFDIGVLATFTEGISNVVMEYMALGKANVTTDGGGTSELVINNKTGLLVKTSSTQDLVEKILQLLEDSNLRKSMGFQAKQRIQTDFSINSMIAKFLNLYQTILLELS